MLPHNRLVDRDFAVPSPSCQFPFLGTGFVDVIDVVSVCVFWIRTTGLLLRLKRTFLHVGGFLSTIAKCRRRGYRRRRVAWEGTWIWFGIAYKVS